MKRTMTAIGVAVVSAVASGAARQVPAPFGIQMGAATRELSVAREIPGSKGKLASVPRPHPDMESYYVQVTPEAGVCWVQGITKNYATSVYGDGARTAFKDLKTQLEGVYGPATVADRLQPGSMWNEPRDYMVGLQKRERTLMATWGTPDGKPIAPGLQFVGLVMAAASRETAYASVEYYFTNYNACEAEAKALKANAFK